MIYEKRNEVIQNLNNLKIHSDEIYQEIQLHYISQLDLDIGNDGWFDQLKQTYCQIQIILSPFRIFKQRQHRLGNLNLQNDSQQMLTNYLKTLIHEKLQQILKIIQNKFHIEYKNKSSYLFELIELISNLNQKHIYVICQNNQLKFEFQKTNMLSSEYSDIGKILEQFYNEHLVKDDPIQIVEEQEYIQQIYQDSLLRNDILIIINDIVFEDLFKWRNIIENIDFNDQIKSLSLLKLVQNFQQNHSPSKGGNQLQFKFYEKFKGFLVNYIQQQLEQFLLNKTIIQQSNEIIEFLQQLHQIICEKYPISNQFQNIVFNSIQQVMNNHQYKNIILVYMDKCIMEQNQNLLKSLPFIIQIYQNDQQFFQQIYLNYQSKFINCIIPQITELDHQILKQMEEKVNNNYIQLMKQIFRDVLISKVQENSFLLIIPQNQWYLSDNNYLQFDFGMTYNQSLTQNFTQNNQNKIIQINDAFSKASIVYRPQRDKRRIEIQLYATQLSILMQFQIQDSQNYQDLFQKSKLDQDSFKFELAILIKKGLIIQQQDNLLINKDFNSKSKLVLLQKRLIRNQNEQVQNSGDLTQRVQALIIKIVKQNKNGIHFMDLKFQINQIIKFNDIKNVLENLIDLNYIERDKYDRYIFKQVKQHDTISFMKCQPLQQTFYHIRNQQQLNHQVNYINF
ncbi:ubiquitin ligase (cullin) of SCF [Paramecium bursaria]